MNLLLNQFAENVMQMPDKIAVVDFEGNRETSYQALEQWSLRIASELQNREIKKGDFVAVMLPRNMEYIAAAIGILMVGGVFLPLSKSYPKERIDFIKKQCQVKIVIDEEFLQTLGEQTENVIPIQINETDKAIIVYTSGSTGKPKGIVHSHRSLFDSSRRIAKGFELKKEDVYLSNSPLQFIAIIIDVFSILFVGGTIHINSEEGRKDIRRIEDYILEHHITASFIAPQMIKLFKNKSDSLRTVICGSERVTNAKGHNYDLYNIYGSSETTPGVTYFKVDKEYKNTPIGKPFDGVQIYILKEDGSVAKPQDEGEICVSGFLAEGYLNMPEETAIAFTANPFSVGEHDKILYHSGDLGKIDADGNIIYINRKDWMLKINGQRVEVGEVEVLMKDLPFLKNALVKGFENQYGQTYMCGYYQVEDGMEEKNWVQLIKAELSKNLSDYMIPAFFVHMDSFPLNQNGKLDRLSLKAPEATSFKAEYEPPKDEIEKIICQGFEHVLGIPNIGRKDNFLSIGGDSIKVLRLQEYCKELAITSQQIFEGKTAEGIAALYTEKAQDLYRDCKQEKDFYALTDSQIGVFVECMQSPESVMYNIPFAFVLPKEINGAMMRNAINKTIEHYPVLKVSIGEKDGQFGMIPNKNIDCTVTFYHVSEEEAEKKKAEFLKAFDLKKGPLFRIEMYETENSTFIFADFHHIISDGASIANFFNQATAVYCGEALQEEEISLFDLSNFEASLKDNEIYRQAQAYFEGYIAGNEVDSNLLFDKQEDPKQVVKPSERLYCNLDGKISAKELEQFTQSAGITENTFFMGAFAYALGKYTGQSESMFAAANNGRHDPRLKNTVGMLVRTMPIYVAFDEEEAISDFLQNLQNRFFETMKHDCCSFGELANKYGIASDLLFVYQAQTLNSMTVDGYEVPMELLETACSLSNIALHVFKKKGSYDMFFEYRNDIYNKKTMESFSNMLIKIMEEFLLRTQLKQVALVWEDEIQTLQSFYGPVVSFDRSKTIVDLFRQQVEKTPENIAVIFKEKRYSYREVDEISERIAAYIHSKGIGKEQAVAILITRCEYMPIASLGVMKSGAAYQPLDSTYPKERLTFMMKDADVQLLIAEEVLLDIASEYHGDVLLTKDIPQLPKAENPKSTDPLPDDLFILLYTSGTTGVPKGCMLTHKGIAAFCHWYCSFYEMEEESVVMAYASYGFDANMMDTYPALSCGASVCIIPEEMRLELNQLNEYLEKENVTHGFMTTQVGRQFASDIENHSLKYFSTGGETLVPTQAGSHYTFCNLYGPTETTVLTTAFKMDKNKSYDSVPIGHALDNIEIYILDKQERRVPVGGLGELCIAGYQVSRGYLNRPEQTEKAFTPNPYSNKDGFEKIYHTGDIVKYLPDGNIQFVGRRDGQVKIRGFRIEVTEVEGIIRKYPGIKDATIMAFDAAAGGKAIAAYIVSDEKVDIEKLNSFICEEKPAYMVPAVTMQIDRIPLNQNMKVNRKALPDPKSQSQNTDTDGTRQLTLLEKELKELLKSIVGHEDFSLNTELARAGLTSLSAIKLASSIEKEYGLTLEVKQIMKQCCILSIEDEIYKYLRTKNREPLQSEIVTEKEMAECYPLSHSQMGVFYDAIKDPQGILYNVPAEYIFPKEITGEKLLQSVKEVIKAHAYVNTRLKYKEGQLVQVPGSAEATVALLHLSEKELESFELEFVQPFILEGGTLYRLAVIETENKVCLLVDFHHIIFDGGSLDLFLHQIVAGLQGTAIPKERYTYFDYVGDKETLVLSDAYGKAEEFFKNMLENCQNASEVTADLPKQDRQGHKAECVAPCNLEKINGFCKKHSVTPAHLFLAGVFYTLSRFINSQEVYISTISNGRSNLKIQNSFGMFVNTIPLAGNIGEDKKVLEFMEEAKNCMIEAVYNEIYPFTKISSDYGFSPQIMYACQLGVLEKVECQGSEIISKNLESNTPKFKISIHIEEREAAPAVCVQYDDALYSQELMNQLAQSIAVCVEEMINNPNGLLRKISLVTKEQKALLQQFRQSTVCESEEVLFHGAFEKQAVLHKDKTALIATNDSFTYGELDAQMNKIANALIEKGLKKGDTVAILLPRTATLIMSMYGVMKAGGVYIPCDPDYPKDRIKQITEDSSAAFMITNQEHIRDFENALDISELLSCKNAEPPKVDINGNDLAYMIYTSGSTGKPKGVMLEHQGIANYVRNHPANRHVHACATTGSVMVSVTTVSFDMSLKETAVALCNGLTLVLVNEEYANNPIHLAKLMKSLKGDIFNATPSRMLQYMMSSEFCAALSDCKVIMSGGEQYSMQLLESLKAVSNARIFNTYGPTEITVSCNAKELTKENTITIGRPLLNYTEYIVDSDSNLLPAGVVGELYIGGMGIARGYHNLPKMTEERFVTAFGERIYKSGDYARWTLEGDVVVLGRTDNQVKLRGLRIEPEEIETCITQYPNIRRSVVLIQEINQVEHLCAYFTADTLVEVAALKEALQSKLSKYMVPTGYCQLDEMPMTANGKIDTRALPKPTLSKGSEYEEATCKEEEVFCDIFQKVLNMERVGRNDDFFELGGTSLTVTSVIIAATKAGFEITYGDVFAHTSPQKLAAIFRNKESIKSELEDLSLYDYSRISKVLEKNNIHSFLSEEPLKLGNIILTGATGFLGIHILREFLEKEEGIAYCILRKGDYSSVESRLKAMLFYYFENDYKELMRSRIILVEGDVTDQKAFEALSNMDIQTVINCAANVKHFSKGTDIEDVNVGAVLNAIAYCKKTNSQLVQVSTTSVSGFSVGDVPPSNTVMTEEMLYFGQILDTKYGHSKFLAERAILEEVSNGLSAKIMRVGNLSARDTDGEFQMNFASNSFVGRLKSYALIGKFPYSMMDVTAEMAPIDSTAQAILELAKTPKACCVFHPYNNHSIFMGDIIHGMKNYGLKIQLAEDKEYAEALEAAQKNTEKAVVLSSMIAYQNMGHGQKTVPIGKSNDYTMQLLYRMQYHWPTTSKEYVSKFVKAIEGLGFFDTSEE